MAPLGGPSVLGAPVVLVTGVSGSGKTTLGEALASALACPFLDADDLHSQANIAKMTAGHPLDDADRAPWLEKVAARLADFATEPGGGVVACSALKRRYRATLLKGAPRARLVYVRIAQESARRRMAGRRHFMPSSLADSQFSSLEEPSPEENALVVSGEDPATETVRRLLQTFKREADLPLRAP